MKNFNYSIICEDIAHSTFIIELLQYLSFENGKFSFQLNQDCFSRWQFTNKSNVISYCGEASSRFFKLYNLDLLFIITDFDDWELKNYNIHFNEITGKLENKIKDKILILLPVRAIETWLYHIKWMIENSESTKNIEKEIENKLRKEMKLLLYHQRKPPQQVIEETVSEIMKSFNHSWLCSRSKSFNHFYINLTRFLQL